MKHIIIFFVCLFTISACTDKTNKIDSQPQVDKLSTGIAEFGINTLNDLVNDKDNTLLSPLSIHTALAMTLQGAKNNTLDQMLSTLEIDGLSKEEITASYKQLFLDLKSNHGATEMNVSNALMLDENRIDLYKEFTDLVSEGFSNEELKLDFSDQAAAVKVINDWAADATNDRITEVLKEIEDEEIMFIVNALYFIGDWKVGFEEQATYKGIFTLNDGSEVEVDIMNSDNDKLSYESEYIAAVDLPFIGDEFSMTYIVPEIAPSDFVASFSNTSFTEWYTDLLDNKLKEQRTFINLPKHEVYSKLKLKETLQSLGMPDAFQNADFTAMGTSPLGPLFLSRVLHDAFIKVDEKGVEGAAVTVVGVAADSAPPVISMNKPFFFVLRHNETGVPIFMGVVNDPTL